MRKAAGGHQYLGRPSAHVAFQDSVEHWFGRLRYRNIQKGEMKIEVTLGLISLSLFTFP